MSRRLNLWTLLAAQIICTGLGLWMQRQYLLEELRSFGTVRLAAASPADREKALTDLSPSLLGIDAITFAWTNGLLGMVVYLVVTRVHDEIARRGDKPAVEALRRTNDLLRTQDAVIFGLAKLADSRDSETGGHLERIALYSSALATALRRRGTYRDVVTPTFVECLTTGSALHDIGKVGIEDAILRKPGPLTTEERRRMQEHTRIGEECLREIERRLGSSNFLRTAREIAAAHHERWDGGGYPAGLKENEIPLAARIIAIADAYDALATKRVYKEAVPHAECVEIIRRDAGRHFDPLLVEAFLEIAPLYENIARRIAGETLPPGIPRAIDQNLTAQPSLRLEAGQPKDVAILCGTSSPNSAKS